MSDIRYAALSEQSGPQDALSLALPLWAVAVGVLVLAVVAVVLLCLYRWRRKRAAVQKKPAKPWQVARIAVGKVHEQGAREGQQDCFAVSDQALIPTHGLLAVVADGMGGLADGDKVSQSVVQAVLDTFLAAQGRGDPEWLLLALARSAVEAVGRMLGPDNFRTSGSTLVMALIREGALSFLSVGDSRICLYRGGVLIQLNREHIYQRELALRAVNGEISIPEAYASDKGSGLTSFLGMGPLTHIDLPAGPIRPIVCSA